jgi:hypothetical protein
MRLPQLNLWCHWCLLLALPLSVSAAQSNQQTVLKEQKDHNSPFNAEFEKLAYDTLELWHVPAVSIAVVDGSESFARVRRRFI